MLTQILNHAQQAKDRLLEQYKGLTRVEALIESLTGEFQNLENALTDLNEKRGIDTAEGSTLDRIGDIVGQDRVPGQSDDDYRVAIKSKIGQNISQGEPEKLIEVFKTLTASTTVILIECFPGAIELQGDQALGTQDEINTIIEILDRVAAAGVRIERLVVFDADEPFSFAGSITGLGFGSILDLALGGKFAGLFEYKKDFAFAGDDPNARGFGSIHDPLVGGVLLGL